VNCWNGYLVTRVGCSIFLLCLCNVFIIRSIQLSLLLTSWCCQILTTCQPSERSFLKLRWSRLRFALSFSRQNRDSFLSQVGNRHPCQKSPSTKMATLLSLKTMSGLPGNERTCRLNFKHRAFSSWWTTLSSEPFFRFTRFIARERCAGVMWSGIENLCCRIGRTKAMVLTLLRKEVSSLVP